MVTQTASMIKYKSTIEQELGTASPSRARKASKKTRIVIITTSNGACGANPAHSWVTVALYSRAQPAARSPKCPKPQADLSRTPISTRALAGDIEAARGSDSAHRVPPPDDLHLMVVGVDRSLRLLRCWGELTREFGLIMAGAAKRQAGAAQIWIGIAWNPTLGYAYIPTEKLLRAITQLTAFADGTRACLPDEYRSLMGLLEHLLIFAGLRRNAMAGLYEPMSGASMDNPNVPLVLSDFARAQLRRWCKKLATCSGVNFTDLLALRNAGSAPSALRIKPPPCVVAYVDAAKDGAAIPGIGGYMLGLWWTMPLGPLLVRLPIPVLELLGIVVSVIIFGDRVVPPICMINASDSVTSVLAALHMSAHAPLMQFLHFELLETPQLQRLGSRALIVHRYGEGNHLADASSRGNFEQLHQSMRALGIRGVQLAVPSAARLVVTKLCHEARKRGYFDGFHEPVTHPQDVSHGSCHSTSLENGLASTANRLCDNNAAAAVTHPGEGELADPSQDRGHSFHLSPGRPDSHDCPWCLDAHGAPERCVLCDEVFCSDCLRTGVCFNCGFHPVDSRRRQRDSQLSQRQLYSLLRCEARDRAPTIWRGEFLDPLERRSWPSQDWANEMLWHDYVCRAHAQQAIDLSERDQSSLRVAVGATSAELASRTPETLTITLAQRALDELRLSRERTRVSDQIQSDNRFALYLAVLEISEDGRAVTDPRSSRHSTSLENGLASVANRLCDNNAFNDEVEAGNARLWALATAGEPSHANSHSSRHSTSLENGLASIANRLCDNNALDATVVTPNDIGGIDFGYYDPAHDSNNPVYDATQDDSLPWIVRYCDLCGNDQRAWPGDVRWIPMRACSCGDFFCADCLPSHPCDVSATDTDSDAHEDPESDDSERPSHKRIRTGGKHNTYRRAQRQAPRGCITPFEGCPFGGWRTPSPPPVLEAPPTPEPQPYRDGVHGFEWGFEPLSEFKYYASCRISGPNTQLTYTTGLACNGGPCPPIESLDILAVRALHDEVLRLKITLTSTFLAKMKRDGYLPNEPPYTFHGFPSRDHTYWAYGEETQLRLRYLFDELVALDALISAWHNHLIGRDPIADRLLRPRGGLIEPHITCRPEIFDNTWRESEEGAWGRPSPLDPSPWAEFRLRAGPNIVRYAKGVYFDQREALVAIIIDGAQSFDPARSDLLFSAPKRLDADGDEPVVPSDTFEDNTDGTFAYERPPSSSQPPDDDEMPDLVDADGNVCNEDGPPAPTEEELREALSRDMESSEIAAQIENDSLLAHSLGAIDPSSVAPSGAGGGGASSGRVGAVEDMDTDSDNNAKASDLSLYNTDIDNAGIDWERLEREHDNNSHSSRHSTSLENGLASTANRLCDNNALDENSDLHNSFSHAPSDAEILSAVRWAFESLDLETGITKGSFRRAIERKLHCPRFSLDPRRGLISAELNSLIRSQRATRDAQPARPSRGPATRAALRRRFPAVIRTAAQPTESAADGQSSRPSRVTLLLGAAYSLDSAIAPATSPGASSAPTARDIAAFAAAVNDKLRDAAPPRPRRNAPPKAFFSRATASLADNSAVFVRGIAPATTAEQLLDALSAAIGEPFAAAVEFARADGRRRGFGWLKMGDNAEETIQKLLRVDGAITLHGKCVHLERATQRPSQPPSPPSSSHVTRHSESLANGLASMVCRTCDNNAQSREQTQVPHGIAPWNLWLCSAGQATAGDTSARPTCVTPSPSRQPTCAPDGRPRLIDIAHGPPPRSPGRWRGGLPGSAFAVWTASENAPRRHDESTSDTLEAAATWLDSGSGFSETDALIDHTPPALPEEETQWASLLDRLESDAITRPGAPTRPLTPRSALARKAARERILFVELSEKRKHDDLEKAIRYVADVVEAEAEALRRSKALERGSALTASAMPGARKRHHILQLLHGSRPECLWCNSSDMPPECCAFCKVTHCGNCLHHGVCFHCGFDGIKRVHPRGTLPRPAGGRNCVTPPFDQAPFESADAQSLKACKYTDIGNTCDRFASPESHDFSTRLGDAPPLWQEPRRARPAAVTSPPASPPHLQSASSPRVDRTQLLGEVPPSPERCAPTHSPLRSRSHTCDPGPHAAVVTPGMAAASTGTSVRQSPAPTGSARPHDYVSSGRSLTLQISSMLIGGESPLSLQPADAEHVDRLASQVDSYCEMAAATGTQLRDATAWRKYWTPFCSMLGTSTWRIALNGESLDELRETWLQTAFFVFVFNNMKPRSPADVIPKPASCLNMLFGVRAIHRRAGIPMVPAIRIQAALKGLHRHFIQTHPRGVAGLTPHRREPFTLEMVRMLMTVPNGFRHGSTRVDYGKRSWCSMRLGCKVNRPLGMRNRDMFQQLLSYASLKFLLGGTVFAAPTSEKLRAATKGDAVILLFPPLKNDQLGQHFAPHPAWLALDVRDPHCAARALIDNELEFPVPAASRETHALFPGDDGRTALTPEHARQLFEVFLVYAVGVANLRWYSFHSWRVTLACALLAIGASSEQICRLVRWVGTSSLAIYARMEPERQMSLRRRALAQDPTSISADRLPDLRGNCTAMAANEAADALAQRTFANDATDTL